MNKKKVAVFIALLVVTAPLAGAQWTTMSLPTLTEPFGVGTMGHFGDGRYFYADHGKAWIQDTWGGATSTQVSTSGESFDPSFVLIASDSLAYIGSGGWGASSIFTLNPSTPATPGFATFGSMVSNYHAVLKDSGSIFLGGGFGSDGKHAISVFDGASNQIIIDNISLYSAGFDRDAMGNLYVSSQDNGTVYFFSAAQIDSAILNGPLSLSDGTALFTFQSSSSIAVDGLGRIWSAGWATTGIEVYDPMTGLSDILLPDAVNENYRVLSFEKDGTSYVGWLNNEDWDTGSPMNYGYSEAALLVVPEPSTVTLVIVAGGVMIVVLLRRRKGALRK